MSCQISAPAWSHPNITSLSPVSACESTSTVTTTHKHAMPFDPVSGLLYHESTVRMPRTNALQRTRGKKPCPPSLTRHAVGARPMKEVALRMVLSNLDDLTREVLRPLPPLMLHMLWEAIQKW